METHWETPPPSCFQGCLFVDSPLEDKRIQEMVISLLYHIRICAVFRNQSVGLHWSLYTCLSSWWSAFFPSFCTWSSPSVGQNSVKLNLQSCWSLLACFSPHPIPCFHAVWMGWREVLGEERVLGTDWLDEIPCASLFKAVGMVIFPYLFIIIFIGVQLL